MDVKEKLVDLSDIQVLQREIECVKRKSSTNCTDCLNCDLLMTDERILTAYKNAIDALQNEQGVTLQEWIPVTKRLPDEHESLFARFKGTDKWLNAMFMTISDPVIVCAECENGERIVRTANTVDGVWKVKDIFCPCKVTHWMPWPNPPKGE